MNWFPTIPGWDGIHPAMVMFPIALLMATPVLLVAGLFAKQSWRPWAAAALVTMAMGTLAAWFAVGTGHAAGQLVDKTTRDMEVAILQHEALGVTVRNLFTLVTLVWAALFLVPLWIRRSIRPALRIAVQAVFLAGYVGALGTIAHAADAGGRLVHERGVRAAVDASVAGTVKSPAATPAPARVPEGPPAR